MLRFRLPVALLLAGSLGVAACAGADKDRLPGTEFGDGGTASGVGGVGALPGTGGATNGGASASGGAGLGGSGSGGVETSTVLQGEIWEGTDFTWLASGELFDGRPNVFSVTVAASAPRGQVVTQVVESNETANIPGVLRSPATWVKVIPDDPLLMPTWQQIDTADTPTGQLLLLVAREVFEPIADDVSVTSISADAAQLVVRVQDSSGRGVPADVTAASGTAAYSLYPQFRSAAPSDLYGYVVRLNMDANVSASDVDITVVALDESKTVTARLERDAATVLVVTMP